MIKGFERTMSGYEENSDRKLSQLEKKRLNLFKDNDNCEEY